MLFRSQFRSLSAFDTQRRVFDTHCQSLFETAYWSRDRDVILGSPPFSLPLALACRHALFEAILRSCSGTPFSPDTRRLFNAHRRRDHIPEARRTLAQLRDMRSSSGASGAAECLVRSHASRLPRFHPHSNAAARKSRYDGPALRMSRGRLLLPICRIFIGYMLLACADCYCASQPHWLCRRSSLATAYLDAYFVRSFTLKWNCTDCFLGFGVVCE